MSEYFALCRSTGEKIQDFNKRLAEVCDEYHITDATLHVFGNRQLVLLSAGVEFATEEDVEAGVATSEGEPIITGVGICCQLTSLMQEEGDKDHIPGEVYAQPRLIEKRMRRLFNKGGETVLDVQVAQCDSYRWVECPTDGKPDPAQQKPLVYVPIKEGYALVIWIHEDELAGDDQEADDEGSEGGDTQDGGEGPEVEVIKHKEPR